MKNLNLVLLSSPEDDERSGAIYIDGSIDGENLDASYELSIKKHYFLTWFSDEEIIYELERFSNFWSMSRNIQELKSRLFEVLSDMDGRLEKEDISLTNLMTGKTI